VEKLTKDEMAQIWNAIPKRLKTPFTAFDAVYNACAKAGLLVSAETAHEKARRRTWDVYPAESLDAGTPVVTLSNCKEKEKLYEDTISELTAEIDRLKNKEWTAEEFDKWMAQRKKCIAARRAAKVKE
jgi:hypothetical protein